MKHFLSKQILSIFFSMMLLSLALFGKTTIYFSPDDKPEKHLIALINEAKKKTYAAVYCFTNKKIAEALARAKNRGVDVQMVTDQSNLENIYNKIRLLTDNNIEVFIYPSQTRGGIGIMHNKFAVIDDKVWTGSFNWTRAANYKNQENIAVLDDSVVVQKYLRKFEILKERCVASYRSSKKKKPTSSPGRGQDLQSFFEKMKRKIKR